MDPWGKVLIKMPSVDETDKPVGSQGITSCFTHTEHPNDKYWVGVCDLDLSRVDEMRQRMPLKLHREQRLVQFQ